MWVGFRNSLFSRPDSRSACFPVLVITVHVFVFIVFASLDGGSVTSQHPHYIQYNCESALEYGWVSSRTLCRTDQSFGLLVSRLRLWTRLVNPNQRQRDSKRRVVLPH